ncbi:hypothetical protein V6Z12_D06G225300 [Gossypium hirsutum]
MIPTFTVPTIFWEDKRGSSIQEQVQLKNELRLKKLVLTSTTIGTMFSPVLISSGKCSF